MNPEEEEEEAEEEEEEETEEEEEEEEETEKKKKKKKHSAVTNCSQKKQLFGFFTFFLCLDSTRTQWQCRHDLKLILQKCEVATHAH